MDPIIVDVNVHPAKLEVRLSKEKELGQLISQMIKEAFHKLQLIPDGEISKKQKEVQKSEQIQMSFEENKPAKEIPTLFSKPTIPEYVPSDEDAPREDDFILETMPPYEPQAEQEEHSKERIPKNVSNWSNARNLYFAQNENGLYIIDQHAAQERIKYEFYREKNWGS